MTVRRPNKSKNPPIFSHEFIIQNHADIVSCIAMVFVIGLMFQATSPVASLFVAMQHNVTFNDSGTEAPMEKPQVLYYTYGMKDFFTMFFYFLLCIVVHAVVQEYILDKLNRKMHLSKVKHSKFNESGQLMMFYIMSAVWGADIIIRENFATNISSLWEGYPETHALLPFIIKFYFIIQIAYWLHTFPELYFQKVKKEEMAGRVQYATLYIIFISVAYLLNFTHVALCMLVLHYTVEFVFHLSRLVYFADKQELANTGFLLWDVLFVLVRLGTITLGVLTFWYGLAKSDSGSMNIPEGNFNTQLVRLNCLVAVCMLQAWMMWNFINFHLRRLREISQTAGSQTRKVTGSVKRKDKKSKAKRDDDSGEDSTEMVDSTTTTENGTVRQRTPRSKKH